MPVVIVGSNNPVKVEAVREVFSKHFKKDLTVFGLTTYSRVKPQPLTDRETFKGALNRAKSAIMRVEEADFGVGIEGGLHEHTYGWFERQIVVIIDKKGQIGIGASGGLVLPDKIVKPVVEEGKELAKVVDLLFGTKDIGKDIGMFGLLTKKNVTRKDSLIHGVSFALARFLNEKLYL